MSHMLSLETVRAQHRQLGIRRGHTLWNPPLLNLCEAVKMKMCTCGHHDYEHRDGWIVGLGIACVAFIPTGHNDRGQVVGVRCECNDFEEVR